MPSLSDTSLIIFLEKLVTNPYDLVYEAGCRYTFILVVFNKILYTDTFMLSVCSENKTVVPY